MGAAYSFIYGSGGTTPVIMVILIRGQPTKEQLDQLNRPYHILNDTNSIAEFFKFIVLHYDNLPNNILYIDAKCLADEEFVKRINDPVLLYEVDHGKTKGFVALGEPSSNSKLYMIHLNNVWWTNTMYPTFGDVAHYQTFMINKIGGNNILVNKDAIHKHSISFYSNMATWILENQEVPSETYLSACWELMFASYRQPVIKDNKFLALYGANNYWHDVTHILLEQYTKDGKLTIPSTVNLSELFGEVLYGVPNVLKLGGPVEVVLPSIRNEDYSLVL